jgi:hypothetical protein
MQELTFNNNVERVNWLMQNPPPEDLTEKETGEWMANKVGVKPEELLPMLDEVMPML